MSVDPSRPRRAPGARLRPEVIELIVARLRVIADATRIRIMGLLNAHDATVQQLADQLGSTHQNVSHHLSVLHQAGMVSRCKEGNTVRYALVDWSGWWMVEQIGGAVAAHLDELQELFAPPATPETPDRH